jgi:CheY-like chemotaxis protein
MPTLAPPKKILTVEDNAIVSADVRAILEDAGYDVCPDARDGIQALEHVRQYSPDLILLDLKLPRVDGVEAASLIREESDAPIIVLTGSSDAELLGRAEAAGTSGLVQKPFSAHGLLSAVKTRLAQRESEEFRLRSIIESMLRDGADEQEIVRVMNAETGRSHLHRGGPSLRRRLQRAVARRRAR